MAMQLHWVQQESCECLRLLWVAVAATVMPSAVANPTSLAAPRLLLAETTCIPSELERACGLVVLEAGMRGDLEDFLPLVVSVTPAIAVCAA